MIDHPAQQRLRRLASTTLAYGAGSAATAAVSILAVPFLTRLLDPAAYGTLDLFTTLLSILTVVTQIGFGAAIVVYYRRAEADGERRAVARSGLATVTATSLIVGIVGGLIFVAAASTVDIDEVTVVTGLLTFLWLPVNVIGSSTLDLLRAQFRARAFAMLNITRALFATLLGIALVAGADLGTAGVVGGQVIVGSMVAIVAVAAVRHDLQAPWHRPTAWRLVRFGLPLVPAGIAAWVMVFSSRIFLVWFGSLEDVGTYALAARIASVLTIATVAVNAAWTPFAVEEARMSGHRSTYGRLVAMTTGALVIASVAMALAAPEIVAIAAPDAYRGAAGPVGFLALGIALTAVTGMVAIGLQLTERTTRVALAAGVAAAASVGLNLILVPAGGVGGAAVAGFAAMLLQLIITLAFAQAAYPVPYSLTALGVVIAVGVGAAGVGLLADPDRLTRLGLLAACIVLVVIVTWATQRRPSDSPTAST